MLRARPHATCIAAGEEESVSVSAELSYEQVFDAEVYGNGDPATFGLPLDLYDRMRSEASVAKLHLDDPLLIDEVWAVTRHDYICEIGRDSENFVSNRDLPTIWRHSPVDPVNKPGLLVQDGEVHRSRRIVIGKAFRPTAINKYEDKFREYAAAVVTGAIEKGTFDFITEIAHALPVQALGDVMGVPEEDRPKFFEWVDKFTSPYDPRVAPSFEEVSQALLDIWAYGLELVARKRREPADDVLSRIAEMDISDDEIMGHVAIFATGAAESTSAALGHGLHELMRNPRQTARLRESARDIPATVAQEMVRVSNPGISILRTAAHDIDFHGVRMREGDRIAPVFPAGNFDPDAIANPRRFDVSRDPNPHVGFGRGTHTCIGKHVAAFEIKILLEELLARTKDIQPAGPISYIKSNVTRGVYSLPVTVTPA
jgi:cholest-4-en-3-one 26-monooxygenase